MKNNSNITPFPNAAESPNLKAVKLPKVFTAIVDDDRLKEVGICKGDELVINTLEAVGNGNLIVIQSGENYDCGFALFLGDGKLRLTYYNTKYEPETYTLSEIKIIGRVLYSSRDWKNYRFES